MLSKAEKGILMPLASLSSKHGIGDFGKPAFEFIDFLSSFKQDYWQLLPLNPIGKGNSPYYSVSSFAGEILYINLEDLLNSELLKQDELKTPDFIKGKIDYKKVRDFKIPLLKKATERFDTSDKEYRDFLKKNEFWINGYAEFCTASEIYGELSDFDRDLKFRRINSLNDLREKHKEQIDFYKITQFFFFKQFFKMKKYAESKKIKLIGDIPFYVSDSGADVWLYPEYFKLDDNLSPRLKAGVPPDIFSKTGQLWGNPIYDFEVQKKDGYLWWEQRLKKQSEMFDAIRIDHFRAFANYYEIPADAINATCGKWTKGPGEEFFKTLKKKIKFPFIIAENLGGEDDEDVCELLKKTNFCEMKILQFCFEKTDDPNSIPENFPFNCVCYTGTHDNNTALGWFEKLSEKKKYLVSRYIDIKGDIAKNMIDFALSLNIKLVIIPLYDYLGLDESARINIPGTQNVNWEWQTPESYLKDIIERY